MKREGASLFPGEQVGKLSAQNKFGQHLHWTH